MSVRPRIMTAAEFQRVDLPEPRWAVSSLIPEGLSILAARPKTGKSWLMLGIAIAVATGGQALGRIKVAEGDCLYLALEDSAKRLQGRLGLQLGGAAWPDRLHLTREWPRGEAGIAELEVWLKEHPQTRIVVIDTLARFRAPTRGNERGYADDYAALEPLQKLATKYQLAIVLVHHQRKLEATDWIDSLSGTLGLAGAADALLGLFRVRGEAQAVLKVTGRDLEEAEFGLRFDTEVCNWVLLGSASETVAISAERRAIVDLLRSERLKPIVIAQRLGKNVSTTKNLLRAMVSDGLVFSDGGSYARAGIDSIDP